MTHSSAVHSRSVQHFFRLNALILAQVDEWMEVNFNPGYIINANPFKSDQACVVKMELGREKSWCLTLIRHNSTDG